MIQPFVDAFMERKAEIRARFAASKPENYTEIVKAVVEILPSAYEWGGDRPDPTRIHEIDDGDYQGTLLYVIAETGYQPATYWGVSVDYGSCSGCDTLQSISGYSDEPPTEKQLDDYMTLALHIVQGLKNITRNES